MLACVLPNTYGTCRAPWPPEQPAPARWDRSCSICPWVYHHRHWSLRPAAAALVVEAGPGDREAPPADPYLGQTATTCYLIWISHEQLTGCTRSQRQQQQTCHGYSSTRVPLSAILCTCATSCSNNSNDDWRLTYTTSSHWLSQHLSPVEVIHVAPPKTYTAITEVQNIDSGEESDVFQLHPADSGFITLWLMTLP